MDAKIINREWSTRPDDQRFVSMDELHAYNVAKRAQSSQVGCAMERMLLSAGPDNEITVVRPDAQPATLTHWAFGQACARAGAPAGYLRSLPAELAVIPLQWSLERAQDDALLLQRGDQIAAFTSPSYGRIYDADMTAAIVHCVDLSVWKVPAASYASKDPKRATTLYASDRDCFVCLVDDAHPITVPGNNGADTLFRGMIVRNSEVGAATFELNMFLYRLICDNRLIHGLGQVQSLKIRHTSGGPDRFLAEARPALAGYLESSTASTVQAVQAAQVRTVSDTTEGVGAWLRQRGFSQAVAKRAITRSEETGGNPRSLWGIVQGLTDVAHEIQYGDERLDLERKAGSLLDVLA